MPQMLYVFHLIPVLAAGLSAWLLFRQQGEKNEIRTIVLGILILFGLALAALFFPVSGFARVQL